MPLYDKFQYSTLTPIRRPETEKLIWSIDKSNTWAA